MEVGFPPAPPQRTGAPCPVPSANPLVGLLNSKLLLYIILLSGQRLTITSQPQNGPDISLVLQSPPRDHLSCSYDPFSRPGSPESVRFSS